VWSATETFSQVRAEGVVYVPADLPLQPLLALRVGGEKLFGRYPFQEAASLGGSDSFRALLRQRYIGDASAYADAELRLLLLHNDHSLVPRIGVFGLGDVGRVFWNGETSSVWHTGYGGGVFLSLIDVNKVVSFTVATSEGQIGFHLQSGFSF
jgi:hemolysin activation/secretion protein